MVFENLCRLVIILDFIRFLVSGSIRSKNTQNILIKNVLDICACAIIWWLFGYGIAYGESKGNFIGTSKFAEENFDGTTEYRDWMFQWAFAGTAATIVSGCLAERTKIIAYFIYSIFITGIIYPFIVHWTWGGGWLYQYNYLDFAGSGIVHLVGGVAGLIGTIIVGRRIGRFDANRVNEFRPHNTPMVVLGTFILWFGWYGFNCGSTLGAIGHNSILIGKIAMNTTISAAISGIICFMIYAIGHLNTNTNKAYSMSSLTNGILAGLVSITASCNNVSLHGALIIGIIGGVIYLLCSKLLEYVRIDDPLNAFPVHGGCGAWGVLAVGFFDLDKGLFNGHSAEQLGIQVVGIIVIVGWTGLLSFIIFILLKRFNMLRISEVEEIRGCDAYEHGGPAYNINNTNSINSIRSNIPSNIPINTL